MAILRSKLEALISGLGISVQPVVAAGTQQIAQPQSWYARHIPSGKCDYGSTPSEAVEKLAAQIETFVERRSGKDRRWCHR